MFLIIRWLRTDGSMISHSKLWCDEVIDMKNNSKKEIKYLNVCMDRALHEEFERFCKDLEFFRVVLLFAFPGCVQTEENNICLSADTA